MLENHSVDVPWWNDITTGHEKPLVKEGFITVEGKQLDSYKADVDTDDAFTPDTQVVSDGYFHESEFRSAPYFDAEIDGIELLNTKF